MEYKCEFAYRKRGNPNIMCKLLDKFPYCGHQRFCPAVGHTILTFQSLKCVSKMRQKENKNKENLADENRNIQSDH